MYYSILHKTRFRYSALVSESVTEVRMSPRSEGIQRCLRFVLNTEPHSVPSNYVDCYGNTVHHFDVPAAHRQLMITAETVVVFAEPPPIPQQLDTDAWQRLDTLTMSADHWDFLTPSTFTHPTPLLDQLAREFEVRRRDDPLGLLRELTSRMYATFAYAPQTTRVDSPIDEALEARRGVCQDFAHIMIALVRSLGIPCRYVSGYLFHRREDRDRSEEDASHAWIEALLPDLGWVGFDPTNNLITADRHIRTAVGRDYADVPPTKGVFKGKAESELDVGVKVVPTEMLLPDEDLFPPEPIPAASLSQQQMQQQQ
ncbi:MAG: transglutaminase family protein [Oscillochloris sp.]|nr:transglutaminase family protein [Oscillochloris sp.]